MLNIVCFMLSNLVRRYIINVPPLFRIDLKRQMYLSSDIELHQKRYLYFHVVYKWFLMG